jgi:hypothetical protein
VHVNPNILWRYMAEITSAACIVLAAVISVAGREIVKAGQQASQNLGTSFPVEISDLR